MEKKFEDHVQMLDIFQIVNIKGKDLFLVLVI